MAGYKRLAENIGGLKTMVAHREFSDICAPCGGYIERGERYFRQGGGVYHFACRGRVPRPLPAHQQPLKKKLRGK